MNTFTPAFSGTTSANGGGRVHHRHSGDFRAPPSNGAVPGANSNGPVPVPAGSHRSVANTQGARGMGPFEGPRSPPNKNSTAHVPCKFFRQGACQAGKACPFMHSNEPAVENAPCKYFQKGNCKFGAKCALAHILPNGVRVNRPNFGAGGPLNLGGRMNVHHSQEAPPPGISLLSMQAHMAPPQNYPYPMPDEHFSSPQPARPQYDTVPTIDTTFSSLPNSNYGSPPNDTRLGVSPIQNKGLSVLDVPLPSSFDSQGVSTFARYGPIAASVPSRFGIESSSPSSYQGKPVGESTTLRNLHNSAFGDDSRTTHNGFGSSPPPASEEPQGRRILHSERFSRQKVMSASVPRPPGVMKDVTDEWEQTFAFEEDCIPSSIAGDVLTPQERNRRSSRTEDDTPLSHRISLSGLGTPADSGSKVGSPAASSPSRFGPLFSRSHKPDGSDASPFPGGSAFGHVGSPLRNSSLHPGASPSLRAVSKPSSGSGDISPFVSSPPRQASMSIITQQLQRTRLQTRANEGPDSPAGLPSLTTTLHPGMARVASGSSVGSSGSGRLDRAVSSGSSIGRSERIEEEQGLFSMEDEEEMEKRKDGGNLATSPLWPSSATTPTANKRYSGGWGGLAGLGGASKGSSSSSLTPTTSATASMANMTATSTSPLGPIGGQKAQSMTATLDTKESPSSGPWVNGT